MTEGLGNRERFNNLIMKYFDSRSVSDVPGMHSEWCNCQASLLGHLHPSGLWPVRPSKPWSSWKRATCRYFQIWARTGMSCVWKGVGLIHVPHKEWWQHLAAFLFLSFLTVKYQSNTMCAKRCRIITAFEVLSFYDIHAVMILDMWYACSRL